jgi:hypothetical protein
MATMAYGINSSDLLYASNETKIKSIFVFDVVKRLRLSPGNAFVDKTIINPEQAYSSFSTSS